MCTSDISRMTHFESLLQLSCSACVFWCVCGLFMMTHTDAETSPLLSRISCPCPGLPSLVLKICTLFFKALNNLAPLLTSSAFTRHPAVRGQPITYDQRCQRQKVAELLLLLCCETCCYLRSPLVKPGCVINQP